ncbi:unnamed protein product [Periconia digitata]|uniref:Uncharacterized protein n=1 Tax=Periconia digitata TaxID=1303443 RepID=A0A9W4XR73_9PLEO|nr:unnamed protein product [Periconia digitata]
MLLVASLFMLDPVPFFMSFDPSNYVNHASRTSFIKLFLICNVCTFNPYRYCAFPTT